MCLLFLMVFLSFVGCVLYVGLDGVVIGGLCVDDFDCVVGLFCLMVCDYLGGICIINCDDDGECCGDSVCIESCAGVCFLCCDEDFDCGCEGYVCCLCMLCGVVGQSMVCVGG